MWVILRDARDPHGSYRRWTGYEESDVPGGRRHPVHRRPRPRQRRRRRRPVHIGVIGTKLKVKEVRALLDGQEAGARANLSLWQHGQGVQEVRGWTYSDARNVRGYQFEYVSWKFKSRSFPNNSQLCVEFDGYDRRACTTIHD
ncbi:hypothetical protein ACIPSA_49860 [Streptomyces sp. NPDC086549]|uniref:hypothetical protein n=1 Tax=Streptomyces sp. NPDC086549 TaxID=3365752 RepID=UPI003802ECAE